MKLQDATRAIARKSLKISRTDLLRTSAPKANSFCDVSAERCAEHAWIS
jgi:hypothetical protein